jgi:hypothetical protein
MINEVDPLTCKKCRGPMRVIAVIEDTDVIRKILNHLGLWEIQSRPPPRIPKSKPEQTGRHIDYSDSQVPSSDNDSYVDPEYTADSPA